MYIVNTFVHVSPNYYLIPVTTSIFHSLVKLHDYDYDKFIHVPIKFVFIPFTFTVTMYLMYVKLSSL